MRRAAAATIVAIAAAVAACGGDAGSAGGDGVTGEIVVFAASSLTDAFHDLAEAFETANPDAEVTFSFAGSSALALQIQEGAPADVFASADFDQVAVAAASGALGAPIVFATNVPVVVWNGAGNLDQFAAIAEPGLRLILAAEDVPIGRYAREILANASTADGLGEDFADRVLANLRSEEANVRAVMTKVQLGEADLGIVYRTDANAAGDVAIVSIPPEYNVTAEYPIAALTESDNPSGAGAWIAFVTSDEGQAILARHGFGAP